MQAYGQGAHFGRVPYNLLYGAILQTAFNGKTIITVSLSLGFGE